MSVLSTPPPPLGNEEKLMLELGLWASPPSPVLNSSSNGGNSFGTSASNVFGSFLTTEISGVKRLASLRLTEDDFTTFGLLDFSFGLTLSPEELFSPGDGFPLLLFSWGTLSLESFSLTEVLRFLFFVESWDVAGGAGEVEAGRLPLGFVFEGSLEFGFGLVLSSLELDLGSLELGLGSFEVVLPSLLLVLGSLTLPDLGSLDTVLGSLELGLGSLKLLLGSLEPVLGSLADVFGSLEAVFPSLCSFKGFDKFLLPSWKMTKHWIF